MRRVIILSVLFASLFSQNFEEKIEPILRDKLSQMADDERINVIFFLGYYDYDFLMRIPKAEERIDVMKNIAQETQRPLVEFLTSMGWTDSLVQLWLSNKVGVKLPKKAIYEILKEFPEVKKVYWNFKRHEPLPLNQEPLSEFFGGEDYISGSIDNVRADEAWRRGYTGKGIVIGHLDTGVDFTHPILKKSYRGVQAWYDPVWNTTVPADSDGHGTGSLGLALGAHGIGVAPGAKWIASNGLMGNSTQLSQSMQWFAGLPDSLRPHLVTNSWGSSTGPTDIYWSDIQGWLTVGIIPVFAIGNEGPGASTTRSPGDYPMVFGIGGTYWPTEDIMSYSSRGPAPRNQSPWNLTAWWARPDWNYHKPDFIAPSEPTVTSAPEGGFQSFGGTSAACPHAAGVIALVLQANNFGINPSMGTADTSEIKDLYQFMSNNSWWDTDWGLRSNTNLRDTFGWGRVDAEKYISNVPAPTGPNVFIDSVWIVSTDDGDKVIEPGERNVNIGVRLKNTGTLASNVTGSIVFRTTDGTNSDTRILITTATANFGNIAKGQTATSTVYTLRTAANLPETTVYYFTFKITANNGAYKKHDFFQLKTGKKEEAAQTRVYKNDNGNATYDPTNDSHYANWKYFASKFNLLSSGQLNGCSLYVYATTGVTETLFVWGHDATNDAPGTLIGYRIINVTGTSGWQYFDFSTNPIPGLPAGYIWVGVSKGDANNNGVPYQDNDGASTTNASSNNRSDPTAWGDKSWWYDFMIRPVVYSSPIDKPAISYEGSQLLDDSYYGNGDGWADPGEKIGLAIALKNLGLDAFAVVGTLKIGDAWTQSRVQILKNVASFGDVPNGNPSANNYNDPWIIQIWDEDSLRNLNNDFQFVVKIVAQYYNNSGGPFTYTTTFNFSVTSPFLPYENSWWWIRSGGDGLAWFGQGYFGYNNYYFTDFDFGLKYPEDSFTIDTVIAYIYNTAGASRSYNLYIYSHDNNNYTPNTEIWSIANQSVAGGFSGWVYHRPNIRVPGTVWLGEYLKGNLLGGLEPIFWGATGIGSITYVDGTLGAPWGDQGYVYLPLGFYFKMRHNHPTITYYAPPGWSWPITPNHKFGSSDTVIDSLIGFDDAINPSDTTFVSFGFMNRSGVKIPIPPNNIARDTWDIYLLMDNYSGYRFYFFDSLPAWSYAVAKGNKFEVPGGRHTLTMYLDFDPAGYEVRGNVFNVSYRYWGMQFSWKAPEISVRKPILAEFVPWPYTDFSEIYYNVTAFKFNTVGVAGGWSQNPPNPKRWQAVAAVAKRFASAGDSIDIDLRLYTDGPSDAYSGYTNVIEASEVEGTKIDYILINGHKTGTTYYAGLYSFGSAPDSAIVDFQDSRALIVLNSPIPNPDSQEFKKSNIDSNAVELIHVFDIVMNAGTNYQITVTPKTGSGLDVAVAVYGSVNEYEGDYYLRRTDVLASADANGVDGQEVLSYTPSVTDTYAIVIQNKTATSGKYSIDVTDGTNYASFTILAALSTAFTAEPISDGIKLTWRFDGELLNGTLLKKVISNTIKGKTEEYKTIYSFNKKNGSFIDKDVTPGGEYEYIIEFRTSKGIMTYGPIKIKWNFGPKEFSFVKFGPSLFRDKLSFTVGIPEVSNIEVCIYNAVGRKIKTVYSGKVKPGYHEFVWRGDSETGRKAGKGVYFVVIENKGKALKKKVIFVR